MNGSENIFKYFLPPKYGGVKRYILKCSLSHLVHRSHVISSLLFYFILSPVEAQF